MRITTLIAVLMLVSTTPPSFAGDLEPPAAPAPTMKSLEEIYSSIQAPGDHPFNYLGTTGLVSADSGLLAMTRSCQATFGAGTRMCTSAEIIQTVDLPASGNWNTNTAWVRASLVGAYGGGNSYGSLVDATGLTLWGQNQLDLSCSGWSTAAANQKKGLVIASGADHEGRFAVVSCDTQAGVACCGPVSP